MAAARRRWTGRTQPDLSRILQSLVFIDETSVKTSMVRVRVQAPRGKRLVGYAPHSHWLSQTFIAGLRWNRLDAPCVIDGPINGELFGLYCETHLSPALNEGDIAILDNLSSHKSARAAAAVKAARARLLFLPPYSPNFNPVEMAFSKIKALLRKLCASTYEELWQAVGKVCSLFTEAECRNYLAAAGYRG